MSNEQYWAKRKARELYTELQKAEDTAEELKKVYVLAANEIKQRQAEILRRFMLKHHLTEEQALRLLKTIKNKNDINALIQALKNDPQNADLAAELESQAYAARINRLTQTQIAVDTVAAAIFGAALPKTQSILAQVARSMYFHEMYELQKRSGYGYAVSPLDPKRITKILNTRWSGQNFSKRLWGNTERLAGAVKEQILLEILTGKTQHFMSKSIDSRFSVGYNETRRLIRTESCYVANQMQQEAYKDTGTEKYIYVAILDLKTSLVCRGLDKKVFKVSEAQAGKTLPPMHPWCRSTTIAWMPNELLAKMKQRAWDPVNNTYMTIPGDMTYSEWYERYVKDNNKIAEKGAQAAEKPQEGRNLTREQYDRYKDRLKRDFPFTYDEFIKLKSNKDEWAKYKKAYREAGKKKPLADVTDAWKADKPRAQADVRRKDEVIGSDGKTYKIDDTSNVVYVHDANEEDAAAIVSREKDAVVEMLPRVNYPSGVKTADCLVNGSAYEIKSSVTGTSPNTLKNTVKKAEGQSDKVILNLQRCKLSDGEIKKQIQKMVTTKDLNFINELVIVWKDTVHKVYQRK